MSTKPLLDTPYKAKVHAALLKRYARFLQPGERFLLAAGDIAHDAWTLAVTFENRDRSVHLPVEMALVAAENPKLDNDEATDVLVDFLDFVFDSYFREAREATLPVDWDKFTFGEFVVRARGWERNLKLEQAADRLLAGESIDDLI